MTIYTQQRKSGFVGARSVALLEGGGTSASPLALGATADKNFIGYFVRNTAVSGDSRLAYFREFFNGAGGGETLRAYATAEHASTATGATVNGAHISLSLAVGAQVSGAGNAARFTLDAAADTRTLGGTLSVVQLDSAIGAGNTVAASTAFMRVTNTGAVVIGKLFNLPTVASAGLLAAHVTDAMTHSIRCVDAAGTVFYIMATTTISNRTGGA